MHNSLLTPRLTLRPLQAGDDTNLLALRANPEVNRYLDRMAPKDIMQARMFIDTITEGGIHQKWTYWAITPHGGDLIGTVCLWNFSADGRKAELGYELHPDYQGQGFMDEAVKKVVAFGFETLGLEMIEAFTHKDNLRSSKLLRNNGFVLDTGVGEFEHFVRATAP